MTSAVSETDNNYVLARRYGRAVVRLEEPVSGRVLEVSTTEPGLQLYLGNVATGYTAERVLRPGMSYYKDPDPPTSDLAPRFDDTGQALAWYDAESDSLLAAVQQALDIEEPGIAFRLAIVPLGSYFLSRGLLPEVASTCEVGLGAARQVGDPQAEAALLAISGYIRWYLGSADEGLSRYVRALELYRAADAQAQVGMTLTLVGVLHGTQGRYHQGMLFLEQALAIARERHDDLREADALTNLAITYAGLGRLAESVAASQRAIALRRARGDRRAVAYALDNLGDAYYAMGEYEQAADCYHQALAIAGEFGDRRGEGIYLANLARARVHLVPQDDTHAHAELMTTARRAWDVLADSPDIECRRIRQRLADAFPELGSAAS
ncbi:MAG: tetratricopeptide repeat protein [Micromonosporaceae bacterium]